MLDHSGSNAFKVSSETVPKRQLLLPLLYFEIFQYPLTASEVHQFSSTQGITREQTQERLDQYVKSGYLYKIENFFLTQDQKEWVDRRKENNHRASKYLKRAYWVTQLIRRFPFVRAVFLSGALSKNVMPKDGDIDYFIVTKPGRLWVSRTLLILFKKLFLFNSHKYFCVNYFVAEDNLEIESKNQFTATEIATLVPLYNVKIYHQFLDANKWIVNYYPNFTPRDTTACIKSRSSKTRSIFESFLKGNRGDQLDHYFLKKTLAFWQRKFANFDPAKFTNALKSRRDVSKHHPQDFQTKVMTALAQKVDAYTSLHNLEWID